MQVNNQNSTKRLESAFTCLFCKDIYKIPLKLPCGNLICKQDLVALLDGNDSFRCLLCDEIHIEPENSFKEDKNLRKIIDIYLLENSSLKNNNNFVKPRSFTLIEACKSKLENLIELYDQMDRLNKDPNENLYLYFEKLREDIRKDYYEKIDVIDKAYETILSSLTSIENEFKFDRLNENADNFICLNIKKEMNQIKSKINELGSHLNDDENLNDNMLTKIQNEIDQVNNDLKNRLNDFRTNLLYTNGKLVKYESKPIATSPDNYGSLKIENKLDLTQNKHQQSNKDQLNKSKYTTIQVIDPDEDEALRKKAELVSQRKSVVFDMSNLEQSNKNSFQKQVNKLLINQSKSLVNEHDNGEGMQSIIKNSSGLKPFLMRRASMADAGFNNYGHTDLKRVEEVYNSVKSAKINSDWYFDKINRNEAEAILKKEENGPGSFLIRKSTSDDPSIPFTLSVKDNSNDIRHYRISMIEDQKLSGGSDDEIIRLYYFSKKFKFKSLNELIDYYSQDVEGFCTKLLKPCKK